MGVDPAKMAVMGQEIADLRRRMEALMSVIAGSSEPMEMRVACVAAFVNAQVPPGELAGMFGVALDELANGRRL